MSTGDLLVGTVALGMSAVCWLSVIWPERLRDNWSPARFLHNKFGDTGLRVAFGLLGLLLGYVGMQLLLSAEVFPFLK